VADENSTLDNSHISFPNLYTCVYKFLVDDCF